MSSYIAIFISFGK